MPVDLQGFDPVLKTIYEGKPSQQVLTQKLDKAIEGLRKASATPGSQAKT